MSIVVRRIRPGEAELLRRVRLAALADAPSAFGSTVEREAAFGADEWEQRARLAAAGHDRAMWLAVEGGGDGEGEDVVGLVGAFRSDPDVAAVELVSMWTAPPHRGRGLGRRLVASVLEWAEQAGAESVSLWVTRGNDAAQRLYASMGFEVTGDVQPLPSDPCKDEVRMRLGLESAPWAHTPR